MEDLRKVKDDITAPDFGFATPNTSGGKSVSSYTNHLPRFVIPAKLIKKIVFMGGLTIGFCILMFPYEIGDVIGYWIHSFWTGLTHRF
jgi:hypothetical protein